MTTRLIAVFDSNHVSLDLGERDVLWGIVVVGTGKVIALARKDGISIYALFVRTAPPQFLASFFLAKSCRCPGQNRTKCQNRHEPVQALTRTFMA